MDNYTLDILERTDTFLLVRLTPPERTEMQSTRIAFLPCGYIVIHGDLCPGGNGLISNGGYGVGWLANGGKPLTPRYMAEKFGVPDVFIAERAAEHLRDSAKWADEPEATELRMLADDAEEVDERDPADVESFLERVEDKTGSPDHAEAFYGPEPRTMGLLIQIQAAFARLWAVS